MTSCSPRIQPWLVALVERLAEHGLPAAEITRLVGAEAAELGVVRPSYESVRRLAAASRGGRRC